MASRFASFRRQNVVLNDRAHPGPSSSSLSLHSICWFSNCDPAREYLSTPQPCALYGRHIRHSSLAEFDSVTAQISSHYLSAECSLNVNVFLGRLHQCEILKNTPLIDNMNHQACVPCLLLPHPPSASQLPSQMLCWGTRSDLEILVAHDGWCGRHMARASHRARER